MTVKTELLSASDETIEDAMQYASPLVLRGLLYQLTGDDRSLKEMVPGSAGKFVVGSELADPEHEKLIRKKAADFLKKYRDSGAGELDLGPKERLRTSLSLTAGQDIPEADFPIWQEETALDRWARGVTGAAARRRKTQRTSGSPSSAPAFPASMRRFSSSAPASPSSCSKRTPASADRGTKTAIPARGSTRRAGATPTCSDMTIPSPGDTALATKTRSISTGSPTISKFATTSGSIPKSSR
jgi:hypothetical protein